MDGDDKSLTPAAPQELPPADMPPPHGGMSGRVLIALLLFALILGLGAIAWAVGRWQDRPSSGRDAPADPLNQNALEGDNSGVQGDAAARPAYSALNVDQQTARILDLEQRLTRVTIAAQSASGYANRAEAMMVAFAARRALDAGAPLDHIEPQLRVLFGQAQPRAVATIVNAAAEPVTVPMLRQGLEEVGATLSSGNPGEGWWQAATRELGSLVVIRKAGAPSPAPDQRLARARLDVESGRIEAAIGELEALRQRPRIAAWLDQARRYNEAHRALDVIEAAAMLESRGAAVVPVPPPVLQPQAVAPAGQGQF